MRRLIGIGMLLVVAAIAITFGCRGRILSGEVVNMNVNGFSEVIESGDSIIILDITSDALGDIIITGAMAYPINNESDAKTIVAEHGVEKPYAVYDYDGTMSPSAAKHLAKQGAKVYHLKGGLKDWIEADEIIMVMPVGNTLSKPLKTKKSQMMNDTTMMKKINNLDRRHNDMKVKKSNKMSTH